MEDINGGDELNKKTLAVVLVATIVTLSGVSAYSYDYFISQSEVGIEDSNVDIWDSNSTITNSTVAIDNSTVTIGENSTIVTPPPKVTPTPTVAPTPEVTPTPSPEPTPVPEPSFDITYEELDRIESTKYDGRVVYPNGTVIDYDITYILIVRIHLVNNGDAFIIRLNDIYYVSYDAGEEVYLYNLQYLNSWADVTIEAELVRELEFVIPACTDSYEIVL